MSHEVWNLHEASASHLPISLSLYFHHFHHFPLTNGFLCRSFAGPQCCEPCHVSFPPRENGWGHVGPASSLSSLAQALNIEITLFSQRNWTCSAIPTWWPAMEHMQHMFHANPGNSRYSYKLPARQPEPASTWFHVFGTKSYRHIFWIMKWSISLLYMEVAGTSKWGQRMSPISTNKRRGRSVGVQILNHANARTCHGKVSLDLRDYKYPPK